MMYRTLLFAAHAFAVSLSAHDWIPAETNTSCDADSDKYISLTVGPEQGDVIAQHACAGILPLCAFPPDDTYCIDTIDFKIEGRKEKTLNALVESKANHNKLSNWAVNFAITPTKQPLESPGVFMTKADCSGYFTRLLKMTNPDGCYLEGLGPSSGNLSIGGTSSLNGTVFGISFVKRV